MQLPNVTYRPNEKFLPIRNTAMRYYVSNYGRVYSTQVQRLIALRHDRIAIPTLTMRGAIKTINYPIDKLVLRLFRPEVQEEKYVKHKDGKELNFHIDNLSWTPYRKSYPHS